MTTIRTHTRHVLAPVSPRWLALPLAAALTFGLAGAHAEGMRDTQGHHGMAAQCGPGMMEKGIGAMHRAHLATLKKQLQLSPEQDAAWAQWVEALKPMDAMARSDMKKADWATLTTPQRLDKMRSMHEEHSQRMAQAMARHSEATKTFYAALTEAQQKTFDIVTLEHLFGSSHRGH